MSIKRAVFVDRDGTIIEEKNYLSDPNEVVLLPGAAAALKRLQDVGFLLIILTNQSGIGRGYYTVADMERVHARLLEDLGREGVRIEKIYYAPEAPEQPSRGRKPSPQFLFDAREAFGLDLAQSYLVGDKLTDVECGQNAGVRRSILVRTGHGTEAEAKAESQHQPLLAVDDLAAAADSILVDALRIVGIIPARFGSSRFPGKPLALIAGRPLIQHVVERCRKAATLHEVIVATDDARIGKAVGGFCQVEMTRPDHPSGSDRIAEVAARHACDAVVNIQGDEPLIEPRVIDAVAVALVRCEMSTAVTSLRRPDEYESPNVVKVVVSAGGEALYFSRRAIPYVRDAASCSSEEQLAAFPFLKHLGIYGYRRDTLLRMVRWPVSPLERAEKLEQLRALENGIRIRAVRVEYDSVGVDVPEDVARVEQLIREKWGGSDQSGCLKQSAS